MGTCSRFNIYRYLIYMHLSILRFAENFNCFDLGHVLGESSCLGKFVI